jgi:hypothetical protein
MTLHSARNGLKIVFLIFFVLYEIVVNATGVCVLSQYSHSI